MVLKKPKLGIFLLVLSAVCVVLKLLISYLFPLSRLLLILLVPVTAVCLVVFLVANRHTMKNGRVLARILIPVLTMVFTLLPINHQLELARFHISKGIYDSAVQEVKKNIPMSDETAKGRYTFRFPQTIATPYYKWADYYKSGNSVAIIFPTSESLSTVWYYAYFSDSTAEDMLVHPRKYGTGMSTGCDMINDLDHSHWAFVSW